MNRPLRYVTSSTLYGLVCPLGAMKRHNNFQIRDVSRETRELVTSRRILSSFPNLSCIFIATVHVSCVPKESLYSVRFPWIWPWMRLSLCMFIALEIPCDEPKEKHALSCLPCVKLFAQVPIKMHSLVRKSEPSTESRTIFAISMDLPTIYKQLLHSRMCVVVRVCESSRL